MGRLCKFTISGKSAHSPAVRPQGLREGTLRGELEGDPEWLPRPAPLPLESLPRVTLWTVDSPGYLMIPLRT